MGRGVDADQLADRVDQGAAGVAAIDGRIGLDEIYVLADGQIGSTGRADDAHGDRLAQSQRVADRKHHITDAQAAGIGERQAR